MGLVKLIPTLKRALGSLLRFQGADNLRSFSFFRSYIHIFFPTALILITAGFALGQATGSSEDASTVNPILRRIERARALAAVHQLQAAAVELENIRASGHDATLRNAPPLM